MSETQMGVTDLIAHVSPHLSPAWPFVVQFPCILNKSKTTFPFTPRQDFEALTPNLLARTVETVEGGGLVIMLVSNLTSLTQLYSVTMDVHNKLRTESHQVSPPSGIC